MEGAAFQMILMHQAKLGTPSLETWVVQSCPGTSASRTPIHPDIPQVCYTLRNRCSQEALYVNGILINDYFHCNKAAGYLKKPHRESFHLIKPSHSDGLLSAGLSEQHFGPCPLVRPTPQAGRTEGAPLRKRGQSLSDAKSPLSWFWGVFTIK